MNNFDYHIPTDVYFGKGQINKLGQRMSSIAKKVLLVYGGGSIKKIGLYDQIMEQLKQAGITVFELAGVEPNPRIQTVKKGVAVCKQEGIEGVLAVGGGSTIDCAKVVSAGACYDGDAWDLVLDNNKIKKVLPIAAVLTLAATGSEMDGFAVISDMYCGSRINKACIFNSRSAVHIQRFQISNCRWIFRYHEPYFRKLF